MKLRETPGERPRPGGSGIEFDLWAEAGVTGWEVEDMDPAHTRRFTFWVHAPTDLALGHYY